MTSCQKYTKNLKVKLLLEIMLKSNDKTKLRKRKMRLFIIFLNSRFIIFKRSLDILVFLHMIA